MSDEASIPKNEDISGQVPKNGVDTITGQAPPDSMDTTSISAVSSGPNGSPQAADTQAPPPKNEDPEEQQAVNGASTSGQAPQSGDTATGQAPKSAATSG